MDFSLVKWKKYINKRNNFMKKRYLFFIISILFIYSCKLDVEVYTNTNEINNILESLQPKIIKLNNIINKTQPNSKTCGITSVTIISNYFNNTNYEVNDLIKKYNVNISKGSYNNDIKQWLQGEIPDRNIEIKLNGTNEEMIKNIHTSLDNNNPVLIIFGAPNPYNKPFYDYHASVIFGIDLDNAIITIANAYGYIEELSLVEFLNRMSLTEIDKYTLFHQSLKIMNRMDMNTYFLIK
jgi:hypothetical protein